MLNLSRYWHSWWSRRDRPGRRVGEPSLRAELFGHEQRTQLARELAARHVVAHHAQRTPLLGRLDDNEEILRRFNRGSAVTDRTRRITPAAEWLLDNSYLIEEQIRLARRHLPRNYARELPQLGSGSSAGLPRVYAIVFQLISHVDAQVEAGPLAAFVAAYQTVSPLRLGELWAVPIMLRLALIENLQRITTRLAIARVERDLADAWVDRLQQMAERNPSHLVVVVADMAKAELSLSSSFVAEFSQRLSRRSPVLHLARGWIEQRLGEQGRSIEQLVQLESQNQAADQVSVSHSITSLRLLGATDWKEFVETLSLVDRALRADPAGVYGRMDFFTRDRYRHAVEALARRSRLEEADVAGQALALAEAVAAAQGRDDPAAHVGFYLVDRGQPALVRAVQAGWPGAGAAAGQAFRKYPLFFYAGGILGIAGAGALAVAPAFGALAAVAVGPLFLALSQPAVALLNGLVNRLVAPRQLPRLDFSAGLPSDCRTLVVVPTLLDSADGVDRLVETLEIHHLANRDPHLHFALLTDFRDAATEHEPDDAPWLARARAGIERLNASYAPAAGNRFFLLHRPRQWNASERCWMGRERKRGKLAELNALLRGGASGCFTELVGDTGVLRSIKYVLTLDSDTQLPRDTARELVATMAHPLNRPRLDPGRRIVTEGYGILQPRVSVSLPGSTRSRFASLYSGDAGIDPYTRAVSDVYQDLFDEGSFVGKGIYDVDAFEGALAGRCPENAVLSHDLLEGCHARAALVSDVELFEAHPAHYSVDAGRRHRWVRGDWQIAPWLRSRVPTPGSTRLGPNPLSRLSQWKIFDNLRRSLVPPAQLALLIAGWSLRPDAAAAVTLAGLAVFLVPGLLPALTSLLRKPDELPWGMHLRGAVAAGGRQLGQRALAAAMLPAEAWLNADAIGRTLLRMLWWRRRLLEWRSAGEAGGAARTAFAGFFANLWVAPAVAAGTAVLLAGTDPVALGWALPFLALWTAAPVIAWWISQPRPSREPDLSPEQRVFLRRTARRTWHFFETFVTAAENWLPPDNFQEVPVPVIASRTSPTNIGFALLANLAARDFGYIPTARLLRRTEDTLGTLHRLKRYRGHFYNWYDTRTLHPLWPVYVSTVDSGNLAGHLLTFAAGLRELADERCLEARVFAGLGDTAAVLHGLTGPREDLARLESDLAAVPHTLVAAAELLQRADAQAGRLVVALVRAPAEVRRWAEALQEGCAAQWAELLFLVPWLAAGEPPLLASADATARFERLDTLPTLREWAAEPWATGGTDDRLRASSARARERLATAEALAVQCEEFTVMDVSFLYDSARELFAIGFNAGDRRRDDSFYDLLASEARLGSFVAIAQGRVPQEHWFSLGRLLVAAQGKPVLMSWSGSMFEYLMPLLVMPEYADTLLAHTGAAAVRRQIAYGMARGVPWGISESGYNLTDVHLNYQYRAFGVPGLGLKRGLGEDLVIAPYASALALMVAPRAACENLQRLAHEGRAGQFGFYEAVDYTPSRLPPAVTSATIRSFMAHHQGMTLLAILHVLGDRPMQRRFLACPVLRATELLLQERVPRVAVSVIAAESEPEAVAPLAGDRRDTVRTLTDPAPRTPEVQLLSNGRYHVVVSSAGGGYSRWHDLGVTRWREDSTTDAWGTFTYLRDVASGEVWSAAHHPVRRALPRYEAVFTSGRVEFHQRHAGIDCHTEIGVSPEDDVELRRVTLRNRTAVVRTIELTSYTEVVLAKPAADASHPAFSNLFVQTEFLAPEGALLCTRRARSADERPPWLMHLMVGGGGAAGAISCETDRSRFIGRGGTLARPAALQVPGPLSNTTGPVLDPIAALRRTVTLAPNEKATVDFFYAVTGSRDLGLALAEKYGQPRMGDRAFALAWTHSQVTLRQLNATEAEAQLYGRLAGALLYADPARRAPSAVLGANRRGQSGLWSYGISGDTPIVLLHISDAAKIELVRQLIQAHSYWRTKGLAVELVIVIEDVSVYRQSLQEEITRLISSGIEAQMLDRPGGIFVRRLDQIPHEDRGLLQAVARIVLSDEDGTLAAQLGAHGRPEVPVPPLVAVRARVAEAAVTLPVRELIFRNGYGGFTRDGHEYVIELRPGQSTPAPWVNVIANPHFGTVVSEAGSAYTWSENAHEFRLTPWDNDPVRDTGGEAYYLRDEQTGEYWSPAPGPARGATPYTVRHGFGYTVFEHTEHGIASELWIYVAMDAPVKLAVFKLRNVSGRARKLAATGYWEWVLGDLRAKSLLHVQTEVDVKTGALLARNPYHTDFAGRIAFVDVSDQGRTLTGDRREFLGRNGGPEQPAALGRARLSGRVGAGLDPCGALQVVIDLADGATGEMSFRLGAGHDLAEVRALVLRFRRTDAARAALEGVWAYWSRTLGAVNVDTPDPAVNVLANGWLLYQTLSCRMWGRTGFYQSGGAYGFRDQLQDSLALVHAEPALVREHVLRAAARQFREGDVQHWWHPPAGRGVRTQFSDDFLWLPYVVCGYVVASGDAGVLDERAPFLAARLLKPEEEACYDLPNRAEESGTLYEHCVRAIERGLRFGAHGLPLIGCGDWNDGMNRVGHAGRGESVWLGFFLCDVLTQFAALARSRQDPAFADRCDAEWRKLRENLEAHAWDGAWYRRAYFDNGEPLGSAENEECQIDSLPQSWAVISGAGDRARARTALDSVERRLVRREASLIQLFDPPFDRSDADPGYIKGYIPGVRENGGQYTHGAIWAAMAFALQGDHERAWELFGLLNPVRHGATAERIAVYKVEPYVVAADVYAVAPHTGRGGWTWYTGSAGWMYRLIVETLLGAHREGNRLKLVPRLPDAWPGYRMHYRFGGTVYHIRFSRAADAGAAVIAVVLDGTAVAGDTIPLRDDRQEHTVEVSVGKGGSKPESG